MNRFFVISACSIMILFFQNCSNKFAIDENGVSSSSSNLNNSCQESDAQSCNEVLKPVIKSFTTNAVNIYSGASVTLSWSVSGATKITISGLNNLSENSVIVSPTATTTYILTAQNAAGSVSARVTVTVANPNSTNISTGVEITKPCLPSGKGVDYQVGPGAGQIASLDLVPWERMSAGDTVRIFYSSTPYRGHILIAAKGTANAPMRICGVKGPNGERPIVDGQNAVARRGLSYTGANAGNIQEVRAIVVIDRLGSQSWDTAYPAYVQIDGLEIRGQHPNYSFTNSVGAKQNYDSFGACIWIERGKNIVIADNEIHDCTNGIYSRSVQIDTSDPKATITEDLKIAGNSIYGNGISSGSEVDRIHNLYIQSVRPIYEFNHIGPLRSGAGGGALKDRSVGSIVRYNYIENGSHTLDFVEAEDYPETALSYPEYHTTFVYGNIIHNSNVNGHMGSLIHYGGDHFYSDPSANWGEPIFRKGTLYFYNNTVMMTGPANGAPIFELSSTEQKAEIWNNVFMFSANISNPRLRAPWDDVNFSYWISGGLFNLGKNWSLNNLKDGKEWGDIPTESIVTGFSKIITGTASPFDLNTFTPLSGSVIVDSAQAQLSAVSQYPVEYQFDLTTKQGKQRTMYGNGHDMGAVERMSK